MPKLHSYVNSEGFYIKARPSDVGNITYQTKREVDTILEDLNYEDGDNVPWGLINPFRAAGLVYTNGEGTEVDIDDAPDLDPSELEHLTEEEAEELLSYLESRGDIPERVLEEVRDRINSGYLKDTDAFREALDEVFGYDDTSFCFYWKTEAYEEISWIEIELEAGLVTHELHLYSHGESADVKTIDEWSIGHEYENEWSGHREAYKTRPKVMRVIEKCQEHLSFEIQWFEADDGKVII